jgi:hypothetical protein
VARKPEIQYIRYYTDGSAARQPEPHVPKKTPPRPRKKKQPKYVLKVQPLAVCGVLISLVLALMLILSLSEMFAAQEQAQQMQAYVNSLERKNREDEEEYYRGLDMEAIERAARALGMVPESEVTHITVSIPQQTPQQKAEITFWEQFGAFLTGLFA